MMVCIHLVASAIQTHVNNTDALSTERGRIMMNIASDQVSSEFIGRLPGVARQGNCKPSKDSHQETNHPCGIRADTEAGTKLHRKCNIKFRNG